MRCDLTDRQTDTHTHRQTHTHTDRPNYSNPRCACAPRVNYTCTHVHYTCTHVHYTHTHVHARTLPVQFTDKGSQVALAHDIRCKQKATSSIDHFCGARSPSPMFINFKVSIPLQKLSYLTYVGFARVDLIICLYLCAILKKQTTNLCLVYKPVMQGSSTGRAICIYVHGSDVHETRINAVQIPRQSTSKKELHWYI